MTANPLTLTTELQAVNAMLRAIGESPVLTLDSATHQDAINALEILRDKNRFVQQEGWRFNTQDNLLLTRNGSNEILVPANTLRVETSGQSADVEVSYINGKLRDVANNTYVWTKDLYVTVTLQYDFSEIPQAARDYIAQLAGLEFIADEAATASTARFSEKNLALTRAALRRTEGLIRRPNMLTGSYSTAKIAFGRQRYYPT